MHFQERWPTAAHRPQEQMWAWSDGHMGMGGGGDTEGLEGARSVRGVRPCWAVERQPRAT